MLAPTVQQIGHWFVSLPYEKFWICIQVTAVCLFCMLPRKFIPPHQEGKKGTRDQAPEASADRSIFPGLAPNRVNTLFAKGNLHLVVSHM